MDYRLFNNKKYTSGFSLTEIMIVVGIIGAFMVLSIPGFVKMYKYSNVTGVADQLAADLRYAQQLTITQVRPHYVQLYYAVDSSVSSPEVSNSYKIYYLNGGNEVVVKRVKLEDKGYITESDFSSPSGQIKFETNGSATPLNDGRIRIWQNLAGTSGTGHYFAVTLKYSTGKVKIYRDEWPTSW